MLKSFILIALVIGPDTIARPMILSHHEKAGDCIAASIMAENDGYRATSCMATSAQAGEELAAATAHEFGLIKLSDY